MSSPGDRCDLVAPGAHILGLRVPAGAVDTAYPSSRVGTRFTRGSGTSQASAVVSGAEFGWRSGSGNWPRHWFDSLVPAADVGVALLTPQFTRRLAISRA